MCEVCGCGCEFACVRLLFLGVVCVKHLRFEFERIDWVGGMFLHDLDMN